jgi:hypothetical protein
MVVSGSSGNAGCGDGPGEVGGGVAQEEPELTMCRTFRAHCERSGGVRCLPGRFNSGKHSHRRGEEHLTPSRCMSVLRGPLRPQGRRSKGGVRNRDPPLLFLALLSSSRDNAVLAEKRLSPTLLQPATRSCTLLHAQALTGVPLHPIGPCRSGLRTPTLPKRTPQPPGQHPPRPVHPSLPSRTGGLLLLR